MAQISESNLVGHRNPSNSREEVILLWGGCVELIRMSISASKHLWIWLEQLWMVRNGDGAEGKRVQGGGNSLGPLSFISGYLGNTLIINEVGYFKSVPQEQRSQFRLSTEPHSCIEWRIDNKQERDCSHTSGMATLYVSSLQDEVLTYNTSQRM